MTYHAALRLIASRDEHESSLRTLEQAWIDADGKKFDMNLCILTAVNLGAAFLMLFCILYDAWESRQKGLYEKSW